MIRGTLYLIPVAIAEGTQHQIIPPYIYTTLSKINHFLAEDIRTARRYLSGLKIYESVEGLQFSVLNKKTKKEELKELLSPIEAGKNLGVLSESGCPGVADPGALVVRYAHENNISVVPLVGPSSLLLALMASGLNGQQFAFHGYLPIDEDERVVAIKELEKESKRKSQTQLLIETPYRNQSIFKSLIKNLHADTHLCVAYNITGASEYIKTKSVKNWRQEVITLEKLPCVFLLLAGNLQRGYLK